MDASNPTLPDRDPNHTLPASGVGVAISKPAPIESEPDSLATTPAASTVDKSFLVDAEAVPVAVSGKAVNGGPVSQHQNGKSFPHVQRQNTDISVSDLHVPGQYPRVPSL